VDDDSEPNDCCSNRAFPRSKWDYNQSFQQRLSRLAAYAADAVSNEDGRVTRKTLTGQKKEASRDKNLKQFPHISVKSSEADRRGPVDAGLPKLRFIEGNVRICAFQCPESVDGEEHTPYGQLLLLNHHCLAVVRILKELGRQGTLATRESAYYQAMMEEVRALASQSISEKMSTYEIANAARASRKRARIEKTLRDQG